MYKNVAIVQQGVWSMALQSMPLAAGYMKSMILADDDLRSAVDVRIHNFDGADNLARMAAEVFSDDPPDVLAFSVFGWNLRRFIALAETYKQVKPDGLVIFGGTHVANQADRMFAIAEPVDVIANGEGERTLRDIVGTVVGSSGAVAPEDLAAIGGISLRTGRYTGFTTAEPERMTDLDAIPSPILSGAIPLLDRNGSFLYDVALLETSRGCPYKCAFCYWGGAVGQKIRTFSRERLRDEVELLAKYETETLVLCDSNFGMLEDDAQFVEDVIRIRERTGYPRAIETSWAKNKTARFYDIVDRMAGAGLRSSFTLALQTLSKQALTDMNRRNMRMNDWQDMVTWLNDRDLDCYAELIWGAPGETLTSFLAGYDELSEKVSRIAAYPLLILPNTDYSDRRAEFGFVTVRGDDDDFEYILSHRTMTAADNRRAQQFLYWARTIAENSVLRNVWLPLRELAGISQSQMILSFNDWVNEQSDADAQLFWTKEVYLVDSNTVAGNLKKIYSGDAFGCLLSNWWARSGSVGIDSRIGRFIADVIRFDLATMPIYETEQATEPDAALAGHGTDYVRDTVAFDHDLAAIFADRKAKGSWTIGEPTAWRPSLAFKAGFANHIDSHEVAAQFIGRIIDDGHVGALR
ncbi:MAG TPA: KedN5 family methylcobalamin-dependent radical SAM C-methyltransferase [Pseudonocardiaceae bacterium]|nr:KedN5 family methylcobalamin-dependent radical SAM C-methyltransferase [Pseudonocardiaceae bacterium]